MAELLQSSGFALEHAGNNKSRAMFAWRIMFSPQLRSRSAVVWEHRVDPEGSLGEAMPQYRRSI
jgi:hypothetical protein